MTMSESLEDNIFALLREAKALEATGKDPVEAATKYYEAVYLMRRFLQRLPLTKEEEPKRQLFHEQIQLYQSLAERLVVSDGKEDNNPNDRSIPIASATPIKNGERRGFNDSQHGIFLDAVQHSSPTRGQQQQQQDNDAVIQQIRRLVGRANASLTSALDLDEQKDASRAIELYMAATELYLQALQLATSVQQQNNKVAGVVPAIKSRIQSALDRVEQLKNPGTQKRPSSSRRRESKSGKLTAEEIEVLKQSSTTVSGLFLPWNDGDAANLAHEAIRAAQNKVPATARFTDPAGTLKLSDKQKSRFFKFARPDEIVVLRQQSGTTKRKQTPVLIRSITPYTIKQQYVTDCSFIASLCVTAAFERRFHKQLITSSIFPQAGPDEKPFYNPLGKYMVKLWLNGVARCVVVDDLLPIDQYGNVLCSHTTGASSPYFELWVSLMEKAYMKLCGGYDFPGSNSGVDLFSLTGWIPERVHFSKNADKVRDFEMLPERAWERISSASSFGDCLISVSSHLNLDEDDANRLGLVMGHAYAVLSVIETSNGTRMLQLKNPWAHKGWKGRFSSQDKAGWQDEAFRKEVGYDPSSHRDDGVFWICWDDILAYFQNFHLSWNPFLFNFRTTTHGLWREEQGPYDDTFNIGENPQYILTLSEEAIQKQAAVWVLISRHVSKQEQEGAAVSDYLTVHVHKNKGNNETIFYPASGTCVVTSAYTNNPHCLVRYDAADAADKHLSLVLSQYQKSNDLRYTLSVYCTEKFTLSKPRPNLPHCLKRSGKLDGLGGPLGSSLVANNPMFALSVPREGAVLELRVSTAKTTALNVIVVPVAKAGQRIGQAIGPAVIDSGKYRHGFLVVERIRVEAGEYTLVVSSYRANQEGLFQISCFSSQPLDLRALG